MLREKVVKSLREQNVYDEVIKGPTYSDWSKGEKTSSFDWKTDGHVTIVQREDYGIEMYFTTEAKVASRAVVSK